MRAGLLALMTDCIQHAALTGYSDGVRTFALPVQRRARIERGQRVIRNAAGEFVMVEAMIFVAGPLEMDERDAVVLQAPLPTVTEINDSPPIMRLDLIQDIDGTISHAEVYV
jgi:hypothetical protein